MAEQETPRTQSEIEALNKAVVQRYWNGKWNERRPEILDELQTPDVVYHGSSMFDARKAKSFLTITTKGRREDL